MPVKARDIREMLNNKVDPGVIGFLCAMAEDNRAMSQQIMELAQMQDKLLGVLENLTNAVSHARSVVDKMHNIDPQDQRNVELDEKEWFDGSKC